MTSETVKQEWAEISYRGYWDVPRSILARLGNCWYYFNSRFDDDLDEYIDHYEVWRMPNLTLEQRTSSWESLADIALERLPDIRLTDLPFIVPRKTDKHKSNTL
jgi:hypothetical protein